MGSKVCLPVVVLLAVVLSSGCSGLRGDRACVVTSEYKVDAAWPQKPAEFVWAQMAGIAVDAKDEVYIFTRSNPAIQVYKADGTFLRWLLSLYAARL